MALPRPMVWGREWEISCWDLEGNISNGGIAFAQAFVGNGEFDAELDSRRVVRRINKHLKDLEE
jgi:hypothetical protein